MNTHVRDNLKAIGDPWQAYTPSMTATTTNPTYTSSGGYMQAGGLVIGWFEVTITTPGNGNYAITLPVAVAAHWFPKPFGQVSIVNGATYYSRQAISTGAGAFFAMTGDAGTRVGHLSPLTFAAGHVVAGSFLYEAA
jgi:hypothetical protein